MRDPESRAERVWEPPASRVRPMKGSCSSQSYSRSRFLECGLCVNLMAAHLLTMPSARAQVKHTSGTVATLISTAQPSSRAHLFRLTGFRDWGPGVYYYYYYH